MPTATANQTISPGAHAAPAKLNSAVVCARAAATIQAVAATAAAARMSSLGLTASRLLTQGVIKGVNAMTATALASCASPKLVGPRPRAVISMAMDPYNPAK